LFWGEEVITKEQVSGLLIAACPSFETASLEHKTDYGEDLLYVELGAFARHLLKLHQAKQTAEFSAVAQLIERLHVEGNAYVKEAATIGLLESIQNVWANCGVDPHEFYPVLLPESAKWWQSLDKFWNQQIRFVGEDIKPKD
jgi:hypothetical protein